MAGQPRLACDDHMILKDRGARDTALRNQNAGFANPHVVADHHEVVDPGARTDPRVVQRAAIDRGVGADLDIALDDHPAELGHRVEALRRHGEAKPVLADARARIDVDPVADQRVRD